METIKINKTALKSLQNLHKDVNVDNSKFPVKVNIEFESYNELACAQIGLLTVIKEVALESNGKNIGVEISQAIDIALKLNSLMQMDFLDDLLIKNESSIKSDFVDVNEL